MKGKREAENTPAEAIYSTLLMHVQIESGKSGKEADIHEIAQRYGFSY